MNVFKELLKVASELETFPDKLESEAYSLRNEVEQLRVKVARKINILKKRKKKGLSAYKKLEKEVAGLNRQINKKREKLQKIETRLADIDDKIDDEHLKKTNKVEYFKKHLGRDLKALCENASSDLFRLSFEGFDKENRPAFNLELSYLIDSENDSRVAIDKETFEVKDADTDWESIVKEAADGFQRKLNKFNKLRLGDAQVFVSSDGKIGKQSDGDSLFLETKSRLSLSVPVKNKKSCEIIKESCQEIIDRLFW